MTVYPQERSTWRSGVISAMHAASQLSLEGGPLMWMITLHLQVNKNNHLVWDGLEILPDQTLDSRVSCP